MDSWRSRSEDRMGAMKPANRELTANNCRRACVRMYSDRTDKSMSNNRGGVLSAVGSEGTGNNGELTAGPSLLTVNEREMLVVFKEWIGKEGRREVAPRGGQAVGRRPTARASTSCAQHWVAELPIAPRAGRHSTIYSDPQGPGRPGRRARR